jgi:hypothetical protein
MGKPKKGGFPPSQPIVNYIAIKDGAMDNVTIAWGDSVVWTNEDAESYKVVPFKNGQPDPAITWADLGPVGTPTANSAEVVFVWSSGMSKDPIVYEYGIYLPGTETPKATATITAQIKV